MAGVDIITLDNFADKMPRWDPQASNQLYALVDMGSNGIRFSISDLSPPRARLLRCVYRERAAISLFDALGDALSLPEDTIRAVAAALARFRSIALDSFAVPLSHVSVFATEAVRRASNAASLLDAIAAAAPGLRVQVLAPEVETLFGSAGARSGFASARGLFLDLGGGSVQMTYVDTAAGEGYEVEAARAGRSLPFGAARLIRVLEAAATDAEARASEEAGLRDGMAAAFRALEERFPSLAEAARRGEGVDVYLCGGGFRGYGSMLMHSDPLQPYPIPLIGGYTVPGSRFAQTARMRRANGEAEGKVFGMSKRRRRQFPAIATVVEALIAALPPIRSVTFCAGGNREGALALKLPPAVREADPLPLLRDIGPLPDGGLGSEDERRAAEASVLECLMTAVPADLDLSPSSATATVYSLGLGPVFARGIWLRAGEDASANAAHALHDAVFRDPSFPGLTHLRRAVLGLTSCARWGGSLAPADRERQRNLKALADGASSGAAFWARYIGASAAALARVVPAWPRTGGPIEAIRFNAKANNKGDKVELTIEIHPLAAMGIDLSDLEDLFKDVAKDKKDGSGKKKKFIELVVKAREMAI
ncbi:Ppx/GppA phosphatase [Pleurostoma richardsiae]|uniref:Ppx/GppA phosphatase n=1 Tax=Pleurostoma richardsiae TaxID=41990 RepID=A0AA38RUD5_9PEZI|nr:Ppx/GppA phosphatase [Pleurostoma richardsiae]